MSEGLTPQQFIAQWSRVELPERAVCCVRPPWRTARGTKPREVEKLPLLGSSTLTNLYNQRPTWLELAHLDRAVLAAYAATDPEGGWQKDWAEVRTEAGAGQTLPDGHALAARRREVDGRVLRNLLQVNGTRAA